MKTKLKLAAAIAFFTLPSVNAASCPPFDHPDFLQAMSLGFVP
ncbi:MAG: hypothetical protein ACI8WB_004737 [Phenylobacterium sp.]|jgi:hypothetical protein